MNDELYAKLEQIAEENGIRHSHIIVALEQAYAAARAERDEWVESALLDYDRLRKWLNARGVTEWEDTVTEVLRVADQERAVGDAEATERSALLALTSRAVPEVNNNEWFGMRAALAKAIRLAGGQP